MKRRLHRIACFALLLGATTMTGVATSGCAVVGQIDCAFRSCLASSCCDGFRCDRATWECVQRPSNPATLRRPDRGFGR